MERYTVIGAYSHPHTEELMGVYLVKQEREEKEDDYMVFLCLNDNSFELFPVSCPKFTHIPLQRMEVNIGEDNISALELSNWYKLPAVRR